MCGCTSPEATQPTRVLTLNHGMIYQHACGQLKERNLRGVIIHLIDTRVALTPDQSVCFFAAAIVH
jgi:hypothetical protein